MSKVFFISLALSFSFVLPKSALAEPSQDADLLRRSLENRCKVSWCQGSYSVAFRRVILDPLRKETIVQLSLRGATNFRATTYASTFDAQLDQGSFSGTCRIKGYGMLAEGMDPESKEITQGFDEAMAACILALSGRLNRLVD